VLQALPTISVQRLFALAVTLKIGFAVSGYLVGDPLWLGMAAPMAVMILYMYVGYYKRESDVSEDKFADSCYYIGFIFTIVSIIMCLIDVPKLSPGRGMYEIAMRFGTAMVSTVLGMIVRVYLVSFRKDSADAIKDVEASLLESTRAFTLQMQDTVKNLQMFQHDVIDASKASVAGVQLQVDALGRNFAESLDQFYKQVSQNNQNASEEMLLEVKRATANLAEAVTSYSGGMQGHLQSIESQINQFTNSVTARLESTTFPDDYFVQQMQLPLNGLKNEALELAGSVRGVSQQVVESSVSIAETLKAFHSKTRKAQDAMGTVLALTEQQASVLRNAEVQSSVLAELTMRLEDLGVSLKASVEKTTSNSDLSSIVAQLSAQTGHLHTEVGGRILALADLMEKQILVANTAERRYDAQIESSRQEALAVMASAEKNALITANSSQDIAAALADISLKTEKGVQVNSDLLNMTRNAVADAVKVAQRALDVAQSVKDMDVPSPLGASPSSTMAANAELNYTNSTLFNTSKALDAENTEHTSA
jgi:hypothetical protein